MKDLAQRSPRWWLLGPRSYLTSQEAVLWLRLRSETYAGRVVEGTLCSKNPALLRTYMVGGNQVMLPWWLP